jgi:hypothetical protein
VRQLIAFNPYFRRGERLGDGVIVSFDCRESDRLALLSLKHDQAIDESAVSLLTDIFDR